MIPFRLLLRHCVRARPHVGDEVAMVVIDAGVQHGNDHFFAALRLRPCFQGIDVGVRLAAVLAGVVEGPLLVELRVIRYAEARDRG